MPRAGQPWGGRACGLQRAAARRTAAGGGHAAAAADGGFAAAAPHLPATGAQADAAPENGAAAQPSDEAMAMAVPEPMPPSPQPPAPTAPAMSAAKLIGLDQAGATSLLGAAAEQSSAPPATIWRYRNATCELDLFFYLDLRSGKMRTLHYAFKGGAANPEEREDCLQSLVIARRS